MRLQLAKVLLAAGCDPLLPDADGCTPLHYSALAGDAPLFECLMEAAGLPAGLQQQQPGGMEPAAPAVPLPVGITSCCGALGYSLLHYAVQGCSPAVVSRLLGLGLAQLDDRDGVVGAAAVAEALAAELQQRQHQPAGSGLPPSSSASAPADNCGSGGGSGGSSAGGGVAVADQLGGTGAGAGAVAAPALPLPLRKGLRQWSVLRLPGSPGSQPSAAQDDGEAVPGGAGDAPAPAALLAAVAPSSGGTEGVAAPRRPPAVNALHLACRLAQPGLVSLLLSAGYSPGAPASTGHLPIHFAAMGGVPLAPQPSQPSPAPAARGKQQKRRQPGTPPAASKVVLPGLAASAFSTSQHEDEEGVYGRQLQVMELLQVSASGSGSAGMWVGAGTIVRAYVRTACLGWRCVGHAGGTLVSHAQRPHKADPPSPPLSPTHTHTKIRPVPCPMHHACTLPTSPRPPQASGADPLVLDAHGCSALMYAAAAGNVDLARELLDAGCDPLLRDAEGWSPLHLAAGGGHEGVVAALLAAGAQVDALDNHGRRGLRAAWRVPGRGPCRLCGLGLGA